MCHGDLPTPPSSTNEAIRIYEDSTKTIEEGTREKAEQNIWWKHWQEQERKAERKAEKNRDIELTDCTSPPRWWRLGSIGE
jgi:hypothetical protein